MPAKAAVRATKPRAAKRAARRASRRVARKARRAATKPKAPKAARKAAKPRAAKAAARKARRASRRAARKPKAPKARARVSKKPRAAKKATKARKARKARKATRKPRKPKRITRKMQTGTYRRVWNGTAMYTKGGLVKKDLCLNKTGKVVSKKMHSRGIKGNAGFRAWSTAVAEARMELGITGFVLMNRGAKGVAFYNKAKELYGK